MILPFQECVHPRRRGAEGRAIFHPIPLHSCNCPTQVPLVVLNVKQLLGKELEVDVTEVMRNVRDAPSIVPVYVRCVALHQPPAILTTNARTPVLPSRSTRSACGGASASAFTSCSSSLLSTGASRSKYFGSEPVLLPHSPLPARLSSLAAPPITGRAGHFPPFVPGRSRGARSMGHPSYIHHPRWAHKDVQGVHYIPPGGYQHG